MIASGGICVLPLRPSTAESAVPSARMQARHASEWSERLEAEHAALQRPEAIVAAAFLHGAVRFSQARASDGNRRLRLVAT